jgi:hypothetical protein
VAGVGVDTAAPVAVPLSKKEDDMKVRHMGMIFDVLSESPSIVNGSRLYLIKNEKFIKYAPVGRCRVSNKINRGDNERMEPMKLRGIAEGAKHDTGKPQVSSVDRYFPHAIEAIARVSEYGATLHGWDTWDTIDSPIERYRDALRRHQLDIGKGEVYDAESGLPHDWHICWNATAIAELTIRELARGVAEEDGPVKGKGIDINREDRNESRDCN